MKKTFFILIKILISVSVAYFLYQKISGQKVALLTSFQAFQDNYWWLIACLLLMPFNWYMEVWKWRVSLRHVMRIPRREAIAGIFSGISLGFITPHAVGDYLARIWSFDHAERKKALIPVLITRTAQSIPTVIFGLIPFVFISSHLSLKLMEWPNDYSFELIIFGLVFFLLLLLIFFRYGNKGASMLSYLKVFKQVQAVDYGQILGLSLLRYMVFSLQFLILLQAFDLDIGLMDQMMGVFFIFFMKSILPTFNFLSDLGIREFSAILYFEYLGVDTSPVILSSLILWTINIVVPALLGLYFIQKFKLRERKAI